MSIAGNLDVVTEHIASAAARSGRATDDITLVAVSKTWPVPVLREAVGAGQSALGENKVQELLAKAPQFSGEVQWHIIGHLQSNKVRKILPLCSLIHTIDSLKLARQVDRIADELGLSPRVLVQVNVAEDEAKFGFSTGEAREAFAEIAALPHLRVEGLMTIPNYDPDPGAMREPFARLRDLRDDLATATGLALPHLSMGMSHDYEIAIEEGATIVRVGSAIFGKRDSPA